jgi:hypothetical protein
MRLTLQHACSPPEEPAEEGAVEEGLKPWRRKEILKTYRKA